MLPKGLLTSLYLWIPSREDEWWSVHTDVINDSTGSDEHASQTFSHLFLALLLEVSIYNATNVFGDQKCL